eukprot:g18415.t1
MRKLIHRPAPYLRPTEGKGFLSDKIERFGKVLTTVKKTHQFPCNAGPVGLDTDSSHNILPGSLLGMARKFSGNRIVDAENPVRFGTIANGETETSAPLAKQRVLLYFRLKRDSKNRIFSAWFEIVRGGADGKDGVSSFPILLGRPFMYDYSVNVCHDQKPAYAVVAGSEVELFEPADIAMAELEFQARSYLSSNQKIGMSKVKNNEDLEYYLDFDQQERQIMARSFMILSGHHGCDNQNEMRNILDEAVAGVVFQSSHTKSKLGRAVYIIDACTRMRVAELADDACGGLTGAAVRAVMLMRLVGQGTAHKIIYDEGNEFNNKLFEKVIRSLNIIGHSVGFKSAHRISKIERMNEIHRKNVRKLTMSPYDPHVAALLWSRASLSAVEESLDEALEQILATAPDSDENEVDMALKRELHAEHCFQVNSTPILGTSLTPYNLNSGGFYAGARDWERLRADLADDDADKDVLQKWFESKARIQNAVRRAIAKKDLVEILRRRELVGRAYKRLIDLSQLTPGMTVQVRRKDGRLCHREEGEVITIFEDGAAVRVGGGTTKYYTKDIALIRDDPTGTALEMYLDEDVGEELERRLTQAPQHGEPPFFADPVTSVQDGVGTAEARATGHQHFGHICQQCDRTFTSRNRLLQHISEKHGDEAPTVPVHAKRGTRRDIDFDDESDDSSDGAGDIDHGVGEPVIPPLSSEQRSEQVETVYEDCWTETTEHLIRWHLVPRKKGFVPLSVDFPHINFAKLTGERETTARFVDNPETAYIYNDNIKRVSGRRRPSDTLHGQRLWVGQSKFRKIPSMFLYTLLPSTQRTPPGEAANKSSSSSAEEKARDNERATVIEKGKVYDRTRGWVDQFEQAERDARASLEAVVENHKRSRGSSSAEDDVQKKQKTETAAASTFLVKCGKLWGAKDGIQFEKNEKIFDQDLLNTRVLEEMKHCVTTMELKVQDGKVFLTPAEIGVADAKMRAYDFTVLPAVDATLQGKSTYTGRLMQSDPVCWKFSQLLNGKEIETKLNNKDCRDVEYAVTAVEIQRNKPVTPPRYRGNSLLLRWGENLTPEFVEEDTATWSEAKDCWVARVFYELTTEAHDKMQQHVEGQKGSAIELSEETAAQLGFECYYMPSVRDEVRAVMKHGIFGENRDKRDVKDKNILSSRLVVVIKVDLGTGQVSRIKSRWVSRGFQDRRFQKGGSGLNCRSHTMSDSSFLFMVQFAQSMQTSLWLGDVKEAFLLGLTFLESYGEEYMKDPNSKVWMEVPPTIRKMQCFQFKELVELVKSLYGCKDAPLNWQKTLNQVLTLLQMRQSLVDPSLWCAFATPQEEGILKQGNDAVMAYFWEKVAAIDKLEKHDVQGAAEIICGQDAHRLQNQIFSSSSPQQTENKSSFLNPASAELSSALTQHFQNPGVLIGALGSHVDDTASSGHILYMLRLYALFRKFPLGSWTRMLPGKRDSFIGREIQVVPECIDQHQMNGMLDEKQQELEDLDILVRDVYYQSVDEDMLQFAEKKYNIGRNQKPHQYDKTPNMECSAQVLCDGWKMKDKVVYVVSQESYGQKMKEISKEEVLAFFRERDRAKNAWMRKQISNPFRKRIGELLWVTKSNALISQATSDMAGELIRAEQANSWACVEHYVHDLNGLILLTVMTEASTRRVARLGDLKTHTLLGCGDASKSRVGGTINLSGPLQKRLSLISSFSKIPRRLREDNILDMRHIPGKQNWTDALTKSPREVVMILLYLNSVWGIADQRILDIMDNYEKTHTKGRKQPKEDNELALIPEDAEKEQEELLQAAPAADTTTGAALHDYLQQYHNQHLTGARETAYLDEHGFRRYFKDDWRKARGAGYVGGDPRFKILRTKFYKVKEQ